MPNIKLKELLEASVDPKLVARSKESGKLVYFKTPQAKKAAIQKGSHEDPKAKKGEKPKAAVKPNSMFGGDYKKDRLQPKVKEEPPVNKTIVYREKDADDVRIAIRNKGKSGISDKAYKSLLSKQTEYWGNAVKDKKFFEAVSNWRDRGIPQGRVEIDKFIQKNPPPPIKMKSPVWRGMGLAPAMYDKFMKMIEGKSEIKLPPSSFSFDVNTAVEFADSDYQIIMNLKSECNELNAITLSELPGEDSIYAENEKELITPSNATYKIESVKTVKFEYNRENITMINLIQKCGMNESEETFADFSKDKFMDSIFGPTQK